MNLDFDKYPILGKPPQTLFEHFRADPRGAGSYPKWIDDRIWELLQRPCELESMATGRWIVIGKHRHAGKAIAAVVESLHQFIGPLRIVLLDGTTIKEWPGNNNAEMA